MQTTLTTLIDRAAAVADISDNFVTRAQWTHWANAENLALALFLARAGWTLNVVTTTITVAGTESGAFTLNPTSSVNPLAIVAVHHLRDGYLRPLQLGHPIDFLRQTPGAGRITGDPSEYRVIWNATTDNLVLNFHPEPSTGTTIVVSYIAHPASITDSVGVSYPMGWEERIVLGMARRALLKEESDDTQVRRLMSEMDQQIEEAVWNRVLAESPTIRNVDGDRRGWSKYVTYPAPSMWWWPA